MKYNIFAKDWSQSCKNVSSPGTPLAIDSGHQRDIALEKDELAIVDLEAGIEHFGRGIETGIDSVLVVINAIVTDPFAAGLADSFSDMWSLLAGCEEVHIVSACIYGGYSHFVKNVVDRSISFVHPYFLIRRGETHHKPRYAQTPDHHVWFYGQDLSEAEKETARALVAVNALNTGCNVYRVTFVRDPREIRMGGSRDASRFNQR